MWNDRLDVLTQFSVQAHRSNEKKVCYTNDYILFHLDGQEYIFDQHSHFKMEEICSVVAMYCDCYSVRETRLEYKTNRTSDWNLFVDNFTPMTERDFILTFSQMKDLIHNTQAYRETNIIRLKEADTRIYFIRTSFANQLMDQLFPMKQTVNDLLNNNK